MDLIRSTIAPESWEGWRGAASMREIRGLLVVTQTWRNHQALANLLGEIRRHVPTCREGQDFVWPEAMFTSDGHVRPWVLDLLGKARKGELSEFSSVVTAKVGERLFARIGGLWLDTNLTKGSRIVLVAVRSPAEEALLEAAPELKEFLALGAYVIVAVDSDLAVSVDTVGISRRDEPDLGKLLEAVRKRTR